MDKNTSRRRERIVVVGGGFAGLTFVKHIDRTRFEVVLIDRNNYHSFPPLFYQVASSALDPASISFPFRRELSKRKTRGIDYRMGSVRSVDLDKKTLTTDLETIGFDRLVIAVGTTNNFFGNKSLCEYVYTLKSTDEALKMRNAMLERLELASLVDDPDKRRAMLSFAVIGGGPAGVEMAGAMGEMKRFIIKREYPRIHPDEVTVRVIEGTHALLGAMSPTASHEAYKGLKALGVEIMLGRLLKSYDGQTITLDDGSKVDAGMVVWTAGITGIKLDWQGHDKPETAPGGRLAIDTRCRVKGTDCVYALGDIAYLPTEAFPRGLPQLAQVAIQQARYLARTLSKGETDREFHYRDKGTMATIGRNRAVADLKHLKLTGFPAWSAWMFIHLMSLLGMRNKTVALINWTWNYFTLNTSLRLLFNGKESDACKD